MKITYDKAADAAYIYLSDNENAKVTKTYLCEPLEVQGMINLDFDEVGKLLGIEIMGASQKLDQSLLNNN